MLILTQSHLSRCSHLRYLDIDTKAEGGFYNFMHVTVHTGGNKASVGVSRAAMNASAISQLIYLKGLSFAESCCTRCVKVVL